LDDFFSGVNISGFISRVTKWSILISLAGIALGTDLLKMKQVGINTIVVARATFIACVVESLFLISEFGLGGLLGLK
jgi:uncharacterized membrane protein YadS